MFVEDANRNNEDEHTRVKVSLRSREVRVGLTRVWRCRVSVTWSVVQPLLATKYSGGEFSAQSLCLSVYNVYALAT